MEKILKCIAVDDNRLFLNQLEAYIDEINWLELIETYDKPVKAASGIIIHKPDIIFLDIEMPNVDGYALVE
ncbi:MAG: response regulator [Bacteroidetes bacterium]|nr:response regulator [Bacteroidota bacterium]MDA1120958.1 response regulator [Bacteroidota bacterium]